jgi:hypothetical protein
MKRLLLTNIRKCADKAKVDIEQIEQGGRHIKVVVQGSKLGTVFVSATASDHRAFLNVVADMRKAGYENG